MASIASSSKVVDEEVNLIMLASYKEPPYKLHTEVALKIDLTSTFSSIPPRVLLTEDIRSYIHYKIGEIGDFNMYIAYQALCNEKMELKPELKFIETLGLTHALDFLKDFKNEWIRVVLSRYHKGTFQLDRPIKVTKGMISRVTGYPTTDKAKAF